MKKKPKSWKDIPQKVAKRRSSEQEYTSNTQIAYMTISFCAIMFSMILVASLIAEALK